LFGLVSFGEILFGLVSFGETLFGLVSFGGTFVLHKHGFRFSPSGNLFMI